MARLRRKTGKAVFQRGGNFSGSIYRGKMPRRNYQGAGVFSTILRAVGKVFPKQIVSGMAKKFAKKVPKAAANVGVGILSDLVQGKNVKTVMKTRGKNLGAQAFDIAKEIALDEIRNGRKKKAASRAAMARPAAGPKKKKKTVAKNKTKQKGAGAMKTTVAKKYVKRGNSRNVFGD